MPFICRAEWGFLALYLLWVNRPAVGLEPCPSTAQSFDVATTEDARDLAQALNCSGGGSFDVLWEGTVIVNETIVLYAGSVVSVAGVGTDAVVDGGGTIQLFAVYNATLSLADISMENGDGEDDGRDFDVTGATGGTGGAVWAGGVDSVVSFSGSTTFINNVAYSGGAVSITDGAVASWNGVTTFDENKARNIFGGAVHVEGGASASWSGRTSFTRNYAREHGGALSAIIGGFATFAGETTIAHNSAWLISSGGIFAWESEVSWTGIMSFDNNSMVEAYQDGYGGPGTIWAVYSVVSGQGKTTFNGGIGGTGGALSTTYCNVSFAGETVFSDNFADTRGGALYAESSYVVLTGETSFFNNRVIGYGGFEVGSGGGVHAFNSTVTWNGTTSFTNNTAYTGGAVYAEGGTRMDWGETTHFVDNVAVADGGAVSFGADVSFALEAMGTDVLLAGNIAGVAGGAVYQSGTSRGVTWTGATFMSNSAPSGGAVYSVASGTATVLNNGNEEPTTFPNVYVNCTFRANTATSGGGAIESAAGKDDFVNVSFIGNTAGNLGGALRLAGTTSISSCDFVGNGAGEAGPAVSNIGIITLVYTSFEGNGLLCAPGAFLNYTVQGDRSPGQSEEDFFDSVCDGCDVCDATCPVDGSGTQQCIPTLENTKSLGVDASGVPITLETLQINPGYWRSVPTSASILACWNEDACLGGDTADANFCDDGYKGPYCAICEDDYAATLAYTCSKCSSGEGIAFAGSALLVALAAAIAVIVHLVSNNHDTKPSRFKRLTHALPLQGLKTILVAWQILTQFDSVANVTYAGVYGQFLEGIASLISFDLGLVLSAGCIARTDFHQRLLISTLGPLIALAALAALFQVATRRNRGSQQALQSVRRKHFSMALLVTFLVYSSVSSTVFRMFDCETLDDGEEYLRADYTIDCTTPTHKGLKVYAVFMILLYPIGIPLLYAAILMKSHKVLKDRSRRSMRQVAEVEVSADLWKPYKPSRYYYEVVECARRVTLTGVVVFIYPNTAAQVAVTLVLAFVFVMVSESMAPYASKHDAWMSRVSHVVVFMSMFQALMIKVDVSEESSDSQEVFGGVLLAANICMVAAVIVEATMVVWSTVGSVEMVRWKSQRVLPEVPNRAVTDAGDVGVDEWDIDEVELTPT